MPRFSEQRRIAAVPELGAKAVWVFYPKTHEVQGFRADGSFLVCREPEMLEEPDVLPGFSLDLKAVYG